MKANRAYTTIEQSRKLAEVLPLESADQTWVRIAIAGANLNVPEEMQYRHNGDMPFQMYSGIGIPCWSVAALLGVLPDYTLERKRFYGKIALWCQGISVECDNPIDACYEMILKLNELNLL